MVVVLKGPFFKWRDPCLVCIQFSLAQWQEIDTWLKGQRNMLHEQLAQLPEWHLKEGGSRDRGSERGK